MRSILFICSANICRSPMAEGLLRAIMQEDPEGWQIESAGIWSLKDYPAAENTLKVLNERGVDLSSHRSRQVTKELMEAFNLILTMERNHKEALVAAFPEHAAKIYMLSEMVGKQHDIADPIGLSLAVFESTAQEMEAIFAAGKRRMRELSERESK
jgi:protein-tyrosine-phosphatase